MKKIIALLLVCLLCFALVACGDSDAKDDDTSVSKASETATERATEKVTDEETIAPTEFAPAVVEPTRIRLNETIDLPFVNLTFTETGMKEDITKSITTGVVTRNFGPNPISGKKYIYINGKVKNPSKEELPVYDFFIGEFDIDGYKFSCDTNSSFIYDVEGNHVTIVEPLGEYDFFVYAEVSNELADKYTSASFRFGFYDQFDNKEMSKNKAFEDDPISMCPYYYIINLKGDSDDKSSDSGSGGIGGSTSQSSNIDTSSQQDDVSTPDNGSGGLDEFLESAAGKQAVESFKKGAEAGGNCTADCYAEGDTLVLEAKLTTQIPEAQVPAVSTTLEEYMEQDTFDSTMKSLVSLLKSNTSCDDPHVKVKYLNADGSVLAEKSY